MILPLLGIVFGVIGLTQIKRNEGEGGGKGMAIAGIICGGIGCMVALIYYSSR